MQFRAIMQDIVIFASWASPTLVMLSLASGVFMLRDRWNGRPRNDAQDDVSP